VKKVALITGGSRGIGLGIARCLAKDFSIAVNGVRPEEEVREVIGELGSYGNKVIYCRGDVGNESHREEIIRQVRDTFGCLHVLVNNAGVGPKQRMDLLEMTPESFDFVMNTNLKGPFFLTREIARWMVSQKSSDMNFEGSIINITSVSSTMASVNRGEYCMAKSALSMMSSLFAVRLSEYDIPVYEVRPGIIQSDMTKGVKEKYDRMIADGITLQRRWGTPEDVGKAVLSLVSGGFRYSTGSVFMVDGGLTVSRL